jgi:hypothetical protein
MSMTRKMKLLVCIAFLLSLSGCGGGSVSGSGSDVTVVDRGDGTALVSWFSPDQNTDGTPLTNLAGYRIYYGNAPGDYDNTITIDEGLSSYMIENLGESDWYFAMTAFNSVGIESDYSDEVYTTIK